MCPIHPQVLRQVISLQAEEILRLREELVKYLPVVPEHCEVLSSQSQTGEVASCR